MNRSADFSQCRGYRYSLRIDWRDGPRVTFCMLNPSTADEVRNDPTVERCQRRAHSMGFAGLIVVNLFALRSTDPAALYQHPEPIGALNNRAIMGACAASDLVICGWGNHGKLHGRAARVLELIRHVGKVPHALKINAGGEPAHPLYIGYHKNPEPMP